MPIADNWTDTVVAGFASDKKYVVETSTKVIERCIIMTTDPGDLVLDPTCGSGTTAYVAEQWGRRWITIDTSRVALALARRRLMAARFPYYSDPPGAESQVQAFRPGADQQLLLGRPRALRCLDLAANGFRLFVTLAQVLIHFSPVR